MGPSGEFYADGFGFCDGRMPVIFASHRTNATTFESRCRRPVGLPLEGAHWIMGTFGRILGRSWDGIPRA
jgi:hypothetical protein